MHQSLESSDINYIIEKYYTYINILMLILMYLYLSKILNVGLLLLLEFYTAVLLLLSLK